MKMLQRQPAKKGGLLIGFKLIFNIFYAKDVSKKVRSGICQKQKNSGFVHSLPFGYYLGRNIGSFEMNGDFTNSTLIILEPIFEEMI